jgi:hypothetical protein
MKKRLFLVKTLLNVAVFGSVAGLFPSCNSDVDFGEQYKKTIYLVHGQDLLYTKEHYYGTENDKLVFSVYCASSETITENVDVVLQIDPHALDSLNARGNLESGASYISKVMLPDGSYTFPTVATVTVPAGSQYALLEIPFYPTGLNGDVAYALPLTVVSNSRNYDISPEARSVVYEVSLTNKYSGEFVGTSAEAPQVVRPVQPVVKAISVNQVRLPIHDLDGDNQYLDTHFMLLTIAEDGQVSIVPWLDADITDLGGNFYDEIRQSYELHYRYTNDSGKMFTVTEKISHVNAPKLVQ